MTSQQWQLVKEVFEATLECDSKERTAFLDGACCGDDEVRKEVESLLTAHDRDGDFMNEPIGKLIPDDKPILTAGQRFGHYEEISLLGQGGMGQVHLALDTRLGRKVALKLLPISYIHDADRVQRLEREARAASALNHPNIVTIHEIGEAESLHFMATEFIDGVTLREHLTNARMTVGEVVEVGAQVASALQAAHEAGIVHRDVKPENIMLRRDGVVKVLDFGLVKLIEEHRTEREGEVDPMLADSHPSFASTFVTSPGVVLGTVAYMSPEQARGEEVDLRTDVWSLGVLLHEMITGHAPFVGATPGDVLTSIREHDAPALPSDAGVPVELRRIVTKALTKEKSGRYQSVGEIARDLKNLKEELTVESRLKRFRHSDSNLDLSVKVTKQNLGETADNAATKTRVNNSNAFVKHLPEQIKHHLVLTGAAVILFTGVIALTYLAISRNKTDLDAGPKRSIAVLPLKPIDEARRDKILETGIADTLVQHLSSMRGFIVRSFNATHGYENPAQDAIAAGREQQVDYVISTSYELGDGHIHIRADIVNVASGQTEYIYQFEKTFSDVLVLQDAIADEIENRLRTQFATTSNPITARRGTTNKEAYRLYLHGMYLANNRNIQDAQLAVEALEQAVELDPNYARAWAGLAYAHRTVSIWSDLTTRETHEKSIAAINRALQLDENLSEGHSALCENKYLYEWDFAGAERECKRAIELEPNSSQAHEIYSRYLMGRGRHDEAIAEIETAIDLEPTSKFNQRNYGRALFYARRYPEAVTQFKRVIAMDQNFVGTYSWLTSTLALQGKESEAYEWFRKLLSVRKVDDETVKTFERAYQTSGWRGVWREWLTKFDKVGGTNFDGAAYNAQLGDRDKALEYLETVFQRREIWLTYLRVDPRLDPLRNDPRFIELLTRVEGE